LKRAVALVNYRLRSEILAQRTSMPHALILHAALVIVKRIPQK